MLGYGVALGQTIETVQATIALAARHGLAQARIALAPAELGEIRIHLSQTAGGLLARVSAQSPAAAQALAEGRGELRQSLHSLGLGDVRVEIGSFSGDGPSGREEHPTAQTPSAGLAGSSAPSDDEPDGDETQTGATATVAPAGARGALVDVLA